MERHIGTDERNGSGDRMAAVVEKSESAIDYALINAWRVLKNVSVVSFFCIGSDHRRLRARIHIVPAFGKRVLNISISVQKAHGIDEELLRQVDSRLDGGGGY